ncbi:MAG: hypothetical protein ABSH20_00380 [Tepidisphaeraceae bacterium]|jgi:hypothetical protein
MQGSLAYLVFKAYPNFQIVFTILAILAAILPFAGRLLHRLSVPLQPIGRRPALCGTLLFIASFAIVSLLATRRGVPIPYVHDEFSYLLAADTFAHGRLTNPTPPAWEHFESMHILVRPTYQSKYPPAQGLVMAFGQVLFGYPIVGVWLSTAGAVLATWWALRAFLPPRWALWGGILMAIHPQVLEWGQRYWGGCIALGAGAVVLGAAGRLSRPSPGVPGKGGQMRTSLIGGAGIVLLAWSRPFEGAVFTVLVFLWAVWQWYHTTHRRSRCHSESSQAFGPPACNERCRKGRSERTREESGFGRRGQIPREYTRDDGAGSPNGSPRNHREPTSLGPARTLAPLALVVLAGLAWLGYYNYRVTGNALRLPYAEHHAQYGSAPLFIFQPTRPMEDWPKYRNPQMFQFAKDQNYDHMRRWKLDAEGCTPAALSGLFLSDKGVVNSLFGMFVTFFGNIWSLALLLILLPFSLRQSTCATTRILQLALPPLALALCLVAEWRFPDWPWSAPFGAKTTLLAILWLVGSLRAAGRKLRGLLLLLGAFCLLLLLETYLIGHYLAPAGILMVLIITTLLRRFTRRNRPQQIIAALALAPAWVACLFWWIGFHGWMQTPADWRETRQPWYAWRDYVNRDFLGTRSGRQLAIVRYSSKHFVHEEWVYNGADLANAKVIWARDLGDEANRKLLAAFPGRQAWLVEPDGERIEPIPYTVPSQ